MDSATIRQILGEGLLEWRRRTVDGSWSYDIMFIYYPADSVAVDRYDRRLLIAGAPDLRLAVGYADTAFRNPEQHFVFPKT